jgi:hypothetical protein
MIGYFWLIQNYFYFKFSLFNEVLTKVNKNDSKL